MPDAIKILEARKAAALRAQRAAEREAAEIDRDLQELERITKKYGISVVSHSTAPVEVSEFLSVKPSSNAVRMTITPASYPSMTMRSRLESAAVIKELRRPVPLSELYERIVARGVKLGGQKPAWVLSAVLGRTEGFVTIKDRGWWLKELGDPPSVRSPADFLADSSANRGSRTN